jgi:hypothetical protein
MANTRTKHQPRSGPVDRYEAAAHQQGGEIAGQIDRAIDTLSDLVQQLEAKLNPGELLLEDRLLSCFQHQKLRGRVLHAIRERLSPGAARASGHRIEPWLRGWTALVVKQARALDTPPARPDPRDGETLFSLTEAEREQERMRQPPPRIGIVQLQRPGQGTYLGDDVAYQAETGEDDGEL